MKRINKQIEISSLSKRRWWSGFRCRVTTTKIRQMRKPVLCEVDERGDPIRIFKFRKKALHYPVESVNEFPYAFAVGMIRSKVFARAGCTPHQTGNCEWCGATIVWEDKRPLSGHLHEKVARGKMTFQNTDNEYSVENSVAICSNCHIGPKGAHKDRSWHTAKNKET